MKLGSFANAVIAALVLSSCSGPKPLTSIPPAKGLKVQRFTWGDGFLLKRFTLPTGDYRATAEDSGGFYYYPQSRKILVTSGFLSHQITGGIYWKKSQQKPQYFFHTEDGATSKMFKKDIPATPIH